MGLLDGSIKASIAAGFSGLLLKGTLRRTGTASLNSSGDAVAGTPVTMAVQGFPDEYSEFYRRGAQIPDTDLKIVLIAGLMTGRPLKGDKVVFSTGTYAGQWFELRKADSDPAGAHWECQAFPVGVPT